MPLAPVSVVIPAYNEETSIREVIQRVREVLTAKQIEHEIVVVDDGSKDATSSRALEAGARVVQHPQNVGYGRSLKTGILESRFDLVAIMDADGSYPVERLPELIERSARFHMVVGARTGKFYRGGFIKRIGRFVFRLLSEFAAGQRIADINSGMRVFRRSQLLPFFPVISAGFSFTTTSTLVYLLNGYFVDYVPIEYLRRAGTSKIHHLRDSLRAFQIIVQTILHWNPIKIFILLALPFFVASLGFAITALAAFSWPAAICSTIFFCTGGVVLGLGFLAVSTLPTRATTHVNWVPPEKAQST